MVGGESAGGRGDEADAVMTVRARGAYGGSGEHGGVCDRGLGSPGCSQEEGCPHGVGGRSAAQRDGTALSPTPRAPDADEGGFGR